MKLERVQVTNFRSIEDTEEFEISDITCLVGKNEAGKTAILEALRGLKPHRPHKYDRIRDYPRRFLSKFDERHPNGKSIVAKTWWSVSNTDKFAVRMKMGVDILTSDEIVVSADIENSETFWNVKVDHKKLLEHLYGKHKLDAIDRSSISNVSTTVKATEVLTSSSQRTPKLEALLEELKKFRDNDATSTVIDVLSGLMPRFFYTSHYERMSGEISLNQLTQDQENGKVSTGDQIFLDFIEYAGTSIEELKDAKRYEELKAKCEGASNDITDEIFEFWSQNEALEVKIELGEGKPEDPPPFNQGTIAKIRIENRNHRASVPLSERSAGFVWFFSFLSQFKQLRKTAGNVIILLDEPGLTLHGKAQADLLRYIQERLLPAHQVIYTTHSPFMVPPEQLAKVRVVEDVVDYDERRRPNVRGTKVSSDILSVDRETIFPLQGHLGYEISQTLFIGQNTLLVEGPSDILYLQAISQALRSRGRTALDTRWTICPTGGVDKIWSFASLFGGNKLNVAVLCDYAAGDKSKIERLRTSQILNGSQVYTTSDFVDKGESDIEDLIAERVYVDLVNKSFGLAGKLSIDSEKLANAQCESPRVEKRMEALFKLLPPEAPLFDHFTPADWLIRNPAVLDSEEEAVKETLAMFEKVFETYNRMLSVVRP